MPAGQSITGIYNIALTELGEDPVNSPNDNSTSAEYCNARYNDVRQAVIALHPWNETKRYAQLAASPTAPIFGYSQQYPLPADFIRMYGIMDTDGDVLDDAKWEVIGQVLMTDEGDPLNVCYHFDLTDPTKFSPLMAQVVGYYLALEIGPHLVRDDNRLARVEKKLETRLSKAMFVTAQQNSPREWDTDVLLRSRR